MEDKNYEREQPPTPIQQNSQHQLQYLLQQSSSSGGSSSGYNSMAENFDPGNCGTLYKVKSFELKREYYYEVNFKCSSKVYLSHKSYEIADMVIVSTTGGSNIGFISREIDLFELQCLNETFATTASSDDPQSLFPPSLIPSKKILSKLKDGDETIHNLLLTKIINERQALGKCHSILRASDSNIQILATEMQFDQKKLFVFLKRSDNSVCRLVRKFFKMFKIKIKIVEVESEEVIRDCAMKYLTLSKLPLTLMDLLPPVAAVAPASPPQNSASYPLTHAPSYGQTAASTAAVTLNIHSDPRHGHLMMDSRSSAHYYPQQYHQHQPQYSPSYSNHYQQGNATALPRNPHRYSSLYQHPNASLQSDLAHYGPPSLKYSSTPLGSQGGVLGQSSSVGYGPPPQPKKPPHHGLLGPLMLISPSSVTSSSHPYFQRTPSSLGGQPFFPQEYQNLPRSPHAAPAPAPPPSPFFDPNWYGGFPPQSQPQSDSDYHFMTSQDQLFGQMNQSSQHSPH